MSRRDLVLINTSHYIGQSKYTYRFPKPMTFKNSQIALHSISLYNSTYNISSALGNNTFSIKWIDGTTYNFTIQDGYYSIPQLNSFLQQECILNDLYMTANNNSQDVYFIEWLTNDTAYKGQINVYTVPDSATATSLGYSLPSGATWTLPATSVEPQLILSVGLGKILGFSSSNLTLPPTVDNQNHSYLSDTYPVLSPVYSYLLTCNLLNSNLNNVPTIFSQIPITASFGNLITVQNSQYAFIPINDGTYSEITVQFYDQDYNILSMNDPEITLYLLIEH